ncbi:hypothetical protein IU468_27625 [Nocardia farcinica]|uniref:hypothetical protein n=1 Tax=Nocardia TaxID=1817 RepID=UPI000FD8F831|nr:MULTISPECIES: hypothetical protein [Nocardia]MBF6187368.1 hypothetical protein [Nocardia farcinica]MBF6260044.1 hypothetical protein [Nocardia farcinica]MBF6313017.1 hypothetical protein [Nocardia farcinica]MBF6408127.1 hypothetical protein [Nocardia farcinica]UEX23241.1 hypothetical protein LMJ57_01605 [Nocardia farcinica]
MPGRARPGPGGAQIPPTREGPNHDHHPRHDLRHPRLHRPATDLYTYQWQLRTHHEPRCRAHYLQGLRNDRYLTYDPADRH